ncbi:hypothetical protein [Paenibacillus protaetiae]|uniref:Helicase XPB/Ssl2 N-terminal domain-containing protein n=1 Tax=Paenibacillus protaetiae TaxID=2509456 RepID=A0A4P6EZJ5_9BACL|nr:hypothetical protein [Paenibacillus protaetiae]QAY66147.1 hypothetical protein ET464_06800 [Paenibacillus protaetiae]
MNLADMLGYADIKQLSRIAEVYQCECNGHSKNELIQSILSTVSRKEVFDTKVVGLKLEDLRFLNLLLFESRESFSLEELMARAQQSYFGITDQQQPEQAAPQAKTKRTRKKTAEVQPESGPREMINRFKHQGWLFNGFSGPGKYLFQVPVDLKTRFRETLKRRFAEELVYTSDPQVYRDEQELLQNDINALLHYVYHNEVQLSADGSMYKRFINQLLERMSIREELPAKGAWRFGYGRHFNTYPSRLCFLYDYCRHAKYIQENGVNLTVTPAGEERLASKPPGELLHLYKHWLKLYKGPIPNLLPLVHWMNHLAEQWVTTDSLRKVLIPLIKPYYYDSAETIMEQRLIMMMVHLGLVRIGEHDTYGTVVRMTKAGAAIVSGVIPDFSTKKISY